MLFTGAYISKYIRRNAPVYINQKPFWCVFYFEAMGKGMFFGDEIRSLALQLYASALANLLTYKQRLCKKTFYSGIELIRDFFRTMLNNNSFCFRQFAEVFERKMYYFRSAAHALLRPSWCFQLLTTRIFSPSFMQKCYNNV